SLRSMLPSWCLISENSASSTLTRLTVPCTVFTVARMSGPTTAPRTHHRVLPCEPLPLLTGLLLTELPLVFMIRVPGLDIVGGPGWGAAVEIEFLVLRRHIAAAEFDVVHFEGRAVFVGNVEDVGAARGESVAFVVAHIKRGRHQGEVAVAESVLGV